MSLENEAVARRLVNGGFNAADFDVIEELVAEDYIENNGMPGVESGRDGLMATVAVFHYAFPDLHYQIEDVFSAADRVCVRSRLTGTHEGDFMGIPASGKQVNVMNIDIMRIRDGRMVEHWGMLEELVLAVQIGMLDEIES